MAINGYLPSYIELLTCLEMSSFAKSLPEESLQQDKQNPAQEKRNRKKR